MAVSSSVLTPGVLVPLCAGAAWVIYRYLLPPRVTRSIDEKDQQALRRFVLLESTHGRPDSVLETIREYSRGNKLLAKMLFAPDQDSFLAEAVRASCPLVTLVLGTQCGYTAIRILSQMPPDGKLFAVEEEEKMAETAEEMILLSGYKNKQFQLLCQNHVEAIHSLPRQYGVRKVDLVVMDFPSDGYIHGLRALAEAELLTPGTLIFLNAIHALPAKDFVDHLKNEGDYKALDDCHGLLKVEYVGSR